MTDVTALIKTPSWAGVSTVYHSDEEPALAEHSGPVVGVREGNRVVMNVRVSQIVLKDGTVEDPMVRIDQDGGRAVELPIRRASLLIDALGDLQDAMNTLARQPMDQEG